MLKLYHASISTCSQKVRLCLAEKHIHWQSQRMSFDTKDQLKPEYLQLNPNGVVPTLMHDDKVIIDSSVICEYLDEAFPSSGERLMPENLHERAKVRAWLRYIEEVPTASIRVPSFNKLFLKNFARFSNDEFSKHAAQLPLREHFYQKMGRDGFGQDEVNASVNRLSQTLDRVNQSVSRNDWLVGDKITLADLCLLPLIVRMEDLQIGCLWEGRESFQRWYKRMKERPSYSIAFYPGSHVSEQDENSFATDIED